ncbi:beta-phosphoglucomutase [Mycoplasma feriruminatoris]|uniref:Beta-phosphoglucomutase n=1 Tax=Mycoplasma feriruminatoris TaxID=1179777 RepID=A0AAX3TGV1_9MOLU|nr:beta-phosphoglucomutase [Mycoplasma feriruminatoris]WFQ92910.1 Beta-phosphoglucomutase [Mycoplasma feriruminatoris]WFQ93754.1 beta-phosphoglucomutase [Mycoplasma feriruminatoris]WFQ96241.1 beta-phosphoglucomutase [Mycoplasma feriruminatoris]
MKFKGVIFDLDGVITDTAPLHFLAWSQAVKTIGITNLDESFLDKLRGISRKESLQVILNSYNLKLNESEFNNLLEHKNTLYKKALLSIDKSWILPGIVDFIKDLKTNNIKICLGSSSFNAKDILTKLELINDFDYLVDPSEIKNSKPAADIFIKASQLLNLDPSLCVVIEDAIAGVKASRAANIYCIGIGVDADIRLESTKDLSINLLK